MPDLSLVSYADGYPGVIENIATIWEEYETYGTKKFLKKNTMLSFDDACAKDFAYIISGIVCIVYYECNGKIKTQLICKKGSLFNELNIITNYHKNKVMYFCYTDVNIIYFKENIALNNLINKYHSLKDNIMFGFCVKMLKFQELFNAVVTRDKIQLAAWYIYYMCRIHGFEAEFAPGIPQSIICSLLGIKKTSMKRAMTLFKNEGIVQTYTKKKILIGDLEKLRALAYPTA